MTTIGPLDGRTVLVTGSSRGIGKAAVEALHRDGAHVVVHFGSRAEPAQEIARRLGDRVTVVGGDLTLSEGAARVWQSALSWRGRIDVLVNNAGGWITSPVDDPGAWAAGWTRNLSLNLTSAADLCRLAIIHFRETGGGIIVNIVSRSAHQGDDADHLAYGAAKGGLLALTKGIARGFAHENVLAYALAPGWVRTELAEKAIAEIGEESMVASLPLGEITPPEDVAEVIAFLASGRARHATGSTIDITGADYVR